MPLIGGALAPRCHVACTRALDVARVACRQVLPTGQTLPTGAVAYRASAALARCTPSQITATTSASAATANACTRRIAARVFLGS